MTWVTRVVHFSIVGFVHYRIGVSTKTPNPVAPRTVRGGKKLTIPVRPEDSRGVSQRI